MEDISRLWKEVEDCGGRNEYRGVKVDAVGGMIEAVRVGQKYARKGRKCQYKRSNAGSQGRGSL